MKHRILTLLLICLLAAALFGNFAGASFGGGIDHDNDYVPGGDGGGGSWGDSGGGSWGDSDWGDSGDGGGIAFIGGDSGAIVIFIVVAVIFLVVFVGIKKSNQRHRNSGPIRMVNTARVDPASLQRLKTLDPQFSESGMLGRVSNLFVTIQQAWCALDYEPIRPFMSNALYEQQLKQLQAMIAADRKNISSDIAVVETKLESFETDGHNEYLNVWLRVKLKDYVAKISNPDVILAGSRDKTYYLDFRWQMMRSAGGVTDVQTDGVKTGECPCCGANINMNQSGKCAYCGSVISVTAHDWVLNKIDKLQQISR